eukprot:CAMPEP_0183747294 /NCGR_PEP_ID=MMETSP0737-20130205/67186_1 /TAXON_ID=385413 /ORGANISM="Thalassiosira miniscula, Strain CCMP1093" /LENGTH=781 /DNA_ID=CAMNT_0025983003 /DNA_START=219 /DNA_END=2564 /DNA_ORIENTATION=+
MNIQEDCSGLEPGMEGMAFHQVHSSDEMEDQFFEEKNKPIPWWHRLKRHKIALVLVMVFISTVIFTSFTFFQPKEPRKDSPLVSEILISENEAEMHFSQVLGVEVFQTFNDEEVGAYESQMQSYTDEFGNHTMSQDNVNTTCILVKQELRGGTPSLLVVTFTMRYETDSGYDISGYPTLFKEYIASHADKVIMDMKSLSLPVIQVGEPKMLQSLPDVQSLPDPEQTMQPSIRPSAPVLNPLQTNSSNATDVCVTFRESNLIDCGDTYNCNPNIGLYGNTTVISKHQEYVQFLSNNGYEYEVTAEFDANHMQSLAVYGIAISDDVAVIGCARENFHTGAIYVFERDETFGTWLQSARIVPDDIGEGQEFGAAVDIDGDIMVVGAPNGGRGGGGSAAYIYRRTEYGWLQETKLEENVDNSFEFGASVSIEGSIVAVGDYLYNGRKSSKGAVFLYRQRAIGTGDSVSYSWYRLGYDPSQLINDPLMNEDCNGWFGSSISFTSDGGLMVGCPKNGALYYYVLTDTEEYVLQQKITPSSDRGFQYQLRERGQMAVDGITMIVGTRSPSNEGRVYVFSLTNGVWTAVANIDESLDSRYFGSHLSLSGNNILISSKRNVYLYTLDDCASIMGNETSLPSSYQSTDDSAIAPQGGFQNENTPPSARPSNVTISPPSHLSSNQSVPTLTQIPVGSREPTHPSPQPENNLTSHQPSSKELLSGAPSKQSTAQAMLYSNNFSLSPNTPTLYTSSARNPNAEPPLSIPHNESKPSSYPTMTIHPSTTSEPSQI